MLGLPLAFAAPAVLAALIGLGVLYFLLRMTPPRPRQELFPPLRLLLGLSDKDTTPVKTPWPLLALRLATAAAVVIAMAGPIWNAAKSAIGTNGALLVVLDDGWPAAPTWDRRLAAAREAMRAATRAGRLVALAPISEGGADLSALDAANFERRLAALTPVPYAPSRSATLGAVERFLDANGSAEVLWIADGLELGGAGAFASGLRALSGSHAIAVAADAETPVAISSVESLPGALKAHLTRADAHARPNGVVRALDSQGRAIGEAPYAFGQGASAEANFELPVELRNEISRLAVADEAAAGAGVADRRALAPPPRRDRLRRQRRHRRAAALAALLHQTRPAALCRNPREPGGRLRSNSRAHRREAVGAGARRHERPARSRP